MIIVVTTEQGGFDRCSQELAKRLGVKEFRTKRYFVGKEEDELIEKLGQLEGRVHITNQNFARYAGFLKAPFLVTVHDLIRNFHDFDGEKPSDLAMLRVDEYFVKQAEHVIAVSRTTKFDLVERLQIPPERITVVYNGVDQATFRSYGDKWEAHHPYVLVVGSERPRKNLIQLAIALAIVRQKHSEIILVKAGGVGREASFGSEWRTAAERLRIPVVFTGGVSEDVLASLYRGALMLVFPSLMEGFGLPPLEAMACGCPVVASAIPSVTEVVGDAGILVQPGSVDDLAWGIEKMLSSREEFIEKGLKRAKDFSWDVAAEETKKVYALVEGK